MQFWGKVSCNPAGHRGKGPIHPAQVRLLLTLPHLVSGRNCKLSSGSLSMASVDILYIDVTRKWNSLALDKRDSGT